MKINNFLRLSFALIAVSLFAACSDNDEPEVKPTPEPPVVEKPVVALQAGEADVETLSFLLTSEKAETVKWIRYTDAEQAPNAETILRDGASVAPNQEHRLTVEGLTPETSYYFVAVAVSGTQQSLSNTLQMTTKAAEVEPDPQPEPAVTLTLGELTETTIAFTLTSEQSEQVSWIIIKKGSREVTPEQVLQYGVEVEPNTTLELTATELEDNTDYEIHAVAKAGEQLVAATPLEARTVQEVYQFRAQSADASFSEGEQSNDFYILFEGRNGDSVIADFYVSTEESILPSGSYTFGDKEPGTILPGYTYYVDEEGARVNFADGSFTVEATVNETDYSVSYAITGDFALENGELIHISYSGPIAGIVMRNPNAPDGYAIFTVDDSSTRPYRWKPNGEVPGEYTFRFLDKDDNELTLDFLLDPATCDNGNAAMPAGTYSIAAGTMDDYSNVAFYTHPFINCYFAVCEVVVAVEGDVYTFTMTANGEAGESEAVWMEYTGKIDNMVRN